MLRFDRRLNLLIGVLTPDEEEGLFTRDSINDLKDAGSPSVQCSGPLAITKRSHRTRSRQTKEGFFRDTIALRRSYSQHTFARARRVVLINGHANVQRRDASQDWEKVR